VSTDVSSSVTAYLGLGSNLNDRVQNIVDARQKLAQLDCVQSLGSSSLYVSSPVGYSEQADFINCALMVQVKVTAENFFAQTQEIEISLGRVRNPRNQNAARIIDIDLLLFGDEIINAAELTLPHPRLTDRLFVIKPLLELDPKLTIPGLGVLQYLLQTGQQADSFNGQIIHKLA
jgi:2-amino-4-hydroxy-6-hydroxymethyldihydropteridine diphosphokinase